MSNIMTVPNQKIVNMFKVKSDKINKYAKINIDVLNQAMKDLKHIGSLKLYIYFAKNIDGYTSALSSSHFLLWSGLSRTAYNTGIKELIEKGYLIRKNCNSNQYNFYEGTRYIDPSMYINTKVVADDFELMKNMRNDCMYDFELIK